VSCTHFPLRRIVEFNLSEYNSQRRFPLPTQGSSTGAKTLPRSCFDEGPSPGGRSPFRGSLRAANNVSSRFLLHEFFPSPFERLFSALWRCKVVRPFPPRSVHELPGLFPSLVGRTPGRSFFRPRNGSFFPRREKGLSPCTARRTMLVKPFCRRD